MAKIRVQDVAKELNVPVQEIMKKLEGLGIFVPNPMSTLQPAEYVQIKSLITGKKIQMVKKKVAKEALSDALTGTVLAGVAGVEGYVWSAIN